MFRENALLHYPARCADNRNVILSRRACGVSKNLLGFPQSRCNESCPYFHNRLYCNPARSFDFVPRYSLCTSLRMTERAAGGVAHCRVPATFRCIRFRERALLHYPARCTDNQNVILSRRACGVSKNLLRLPRSSCYAIMPAFLHTNSIVALQDPSTSRLAFRSALRSG